MSEPLPTESASGYSQSARDAIRSRMIGYAKRHRIGVPTLLARMATATGRTQDQISQKTLQNFLGGTRRTNDGFVKICDEFVRKAVDADQGLSLGHALGDFFGEDTETIRPISPELPGSFSGESPAASVAQGVRKGPVDVSRVPYSTLTIEKSLHGSFVPVSEEVFNWNRAAGLEFDEQTPRRSYRGYAVMCGEILFVVAKNVLTGLARTYWLTGDERFLTGRGAEAPFMPLPEETEMSLHEVRVTYRRHEGAA